MDGVQGPLHFTEGCADDLPHLITQVATAPATQQDHQALDAIQADLAAHDLLPAQQLVDAGDISAQRILHSRDQHAVDLIGPVDSDPRWQARTPDAGRRTPGAGRRTPGAGEVSHFSIDWQHQARYLSALPERVT